MKILINTFSDVNNFCKICSKYESDIDVKSSRYVIDGKSIMGLFSLALNDPVEVNINTENENEKECFYKEIEKYHVL